MRTNLPVTTTELELPEGTTLVSTTDLTGRITYCNPTFVAVSGYSREELVGQPHNVLRHPDMPREAFRDMWETIKEGRPWAACVKNRRKNGDHYWVLANVTPLVENGKPTGYMSVRTKASREQIRAAEVLYRQMWTEAKARRPVTRLSEGYVWYDTPVGRARRALALGLEARTALVMAAMVAVFASTNRLFGEVPSVLAGAVAAALAFAWLRRGLVTPLRDQIAASTRRAAGDLTAAVRVDRSDEVGRLQRATNQLSVNLQAIVSDVRREVERMHVATTDIAGGVQDLADRTSSQVAGLEETAAAVEEISSTVAQNAQASRSVHGVTTSALDSAARGSDVMREVSATMDGIRQASKKIGDIIHVIEDIAFQTNILALNAAVEAARAGEHGKGFAVVASEVRGLSGNTSTAAREVKELIRTTVARIEDGVGRVRRAGEQSDQVVERVSEVSKLVESIASATIEQAAGLRQVSTAMSSLDSTTQANGAMVESSSQACSDLREKADVLRDAVSVFKMAPAAELRIPIEDDAPYASEVLPRAHGARRKAA